MFDANYLKWYLRGSQNTVETENDSESEWFSSDSDCGESMKRNPKAHHFSSFKDANLFMTRRTIKRGIDVMEICGGPGCGGVIKVAICKQLTGGCNFDIQVGCDLTETDQQDELWSYILKHRPKVIVMVPPCTAFGSWGQYNKEHYRATWLKTYKSGVK